MMPAHPAPAQPHRVLVVGGGPAGLMAAETLAAAGIAVDLFDAMPSVGRKFLMAGKGGLNLTHAEPSEKFLARYGERQPQLEPLIADFGAEALRHWAEDLGVATFVGSSGRVFPTGMKAAPLLRAWVHRLHRAGVRFHVRHRMKEIGADGTLYFAVPGGTATARGDAAVLALGGGSWAKLGSDGAWVAMLRDLGIAIAPLRPANCGFDVAWSEHFRERFAGQPVKSVTAAAQGGAARPGEFVVTQHGIEGSLIYALSANLRDAIERDGAATLQIDLLPGRALEWVQREIAHPRGSRSMASHLQSRLGLAGVKAGLLRECASRDDYADPARLATAIKALPLRLAAPRPLDEAISSAGGVRFEALDEGLMLRQRPGLFCAGEMLDWEAPTGGYLLTACFATGRAAALGAIHFLKRDR